MADDIGRADPLASSGTGMPASDAAEFDHEALAARPRRVAFQSILYEHDRVGARDAPSEAPEYFRDLNLDQIVDAITAGKDEYGLKPFFHDPLKTTGAVLYRHEVMRDLEDSRILSCIKTFASSMRLMRERIAEANKLFYKYQKERRFLHAAETYCDAVRRLSEELRSLPLRARGLVALRGYASDYAASGGFLSLLAAVQSLTDGLATVRYAVLLSPARAG
jgi:hypothetical protein